MQIATVPYDPRFPATNQARNCYTRYNEYYKCIAVSHPLLASTKRHVLVYDSVSQCCSRELVYAEELGLVILASSVVSCATLRGLTLCAYKQDLDLSALLGTCRAAVPIQAMQAPKTLLSWLRCAACACAGEVRGLTGLQVLPEGIPVSVPQRLGAHVGPLLTVN